MDRPEFLTVATFGNDTEEEIRLYLELWGEQVILSPGHRVHLLARPSPDLLPLAIVQVEGGLQIYADKETDPDWHVLFEGKLIKAVPLLRLSDYQ